MPIIGVSMPANIEAATKRLVTEIKALDVQVDAAGARVPETTRMAWKLWAKGTVDALVAVLMKSATRTTALIFPLWPAGAVFAGGAVTVDKALDDSFIAGEYAKLNVWRETLKTAGVAVVGPAPTAPPGMTLPGAGGGAIDTLVKGVMTLGVVGLAIFAGSKLLGR